MKRASAERDEAWKALVEELQGENERCTKQAAGMLLLEQVGRCVCPVFALILLETLSLRLRI